MTAVAGRRRPSRGQAVSAAAARVAGRVTAGGAITTGVAATIVILSLWAQSGVTLGPNSRAQVLLVVAGCALVAATLVLRDRHAPQRSLYGSWSLAAFGLLALVTALSITWSFDAPESWLETNRTLSYFAAFAGGVALVRLAPAHWPALLKGVALGATLVCVVALLSKAFPQFFSESEVFARLRTPFGYWNAVGLMAASAVPPLLWLAGRRSGHAAANALAYPALGVVLVTLLQTYSRGSLLALLVGLIVWFAVVPLRLRAATALIVAAIPSAGVIAFSFSQAGLTKDGQPLVVRADAGLQFGLLLLLLVVVLLGIGLAVGFFSAQHPPTARTRRRAGQTIVAVLGAAVAAGVLALATAPGGIDGQVSAAWKSITNPDASAPSNAPDRLTATSSVRALYWDEALDVHALSPWVGTGAGSYGLLRKRYREEDIEVQDAHGYVFQTLSDLGWLGIGVSLLVTVAVLGAAFRATGLRRRDRGLGWDAERVGMVTLLSVVLIYGAHSLLDWTWFIPANTVLAVICAGWIVGRGPLRARLKREGPTGMVRAAERVGMVPSRGAFSWREWVAHWRPAPSALALGVLVVVAGAATSWAIVQPLRASNAGDIALARLDAGQIGPAADIARIAERRDPLSPEPLFALAAIQAGAGDAAAAEATLREATRKQPTDPEVWRRLGRLLSQDPARVRDALRPFQAAYFLDPASAEAQSDLLKLARALTALEQQEATAKALADAQKQQEQQQQDDDQERKDP